jgi:arabinose-5-phosphate isomerase
VSTRRRFAPDANWFEAIAAIGRGGLGAVCVAQADGTLLGIITDGDIRRALEVVAHDGITPEETAHLNRLTARDLMTHAPVTCAPEALAYDALRLMEDRPSQINVLPVVDRATRLVGMIRLHDIVRNGL